MTDHLVDLIKEIQEKITDASDMVYTNYENSKQLRDVLQTYIEEVQQGDIKCIEKLQMLFLPTATLQEHSICNGWATEYICLAEKFDNLYKKAKKHS